MEKKIVEVEVNIDLTLRCEGIDELFDLHGLEVESFYACSTKCFKPPPEGVKRIFFCISNYEVRGAEKSDLSNSIYEVREELFGEDHHLIDGYTTPVWWWIEYEM